MDQLWAELDIGTLGQFVIERGWRLLIILLVTLVALRGLTWLTTWLSARVQRLDKVENSEFDQRTQTIFRFVRSVGVVIIVIVAILMVLSEAGVDTTPLLASVGVVGLAVGLGAQTLVKDAIAGLFILMEGQYTVGDTISVNGITGGVEMLALRTTHLRDLSGTLHIIPNGEIRTVSNLTQDWSRAVVEVNVALTEDVDHVMATLNDVLARLQADEAFAALLLEPLAVTGPESYDNLGLRLRVLGKVLPGQQWPAMRTIRRHIHDAFRAADIALAVPHQTMRVMDRSISP